MKKVEITKEQLAYIELLVVSYMTTVENKAGLPECDVLRMVGEIDKVWDRSFKVVRQ